MTWFTRRLCQFGTTGSTRAQVLPAAGETELRDEGRRAGEGAVLGFGEMFSLCFLAGRRCLGRGRGRALGLCRESSEDDEEERERERLPVERFEEINLENNQVFQISDKHHIKHSEKVQENY